MFGCNRDQSCLGAEHGISVFEKSVNLGKFINSLVGVETSFPTPEGSCFRIKHHTAAEKMRNS